MEAIPWWQGATPHSSIKKGQVNEALFEAKLGEAINDRGPDEYRLADIFFAKTFLTSGLRGLLLDILRTIKGERAANSIVNLKTSFGGGKTHTELAIYHLFQHPEVALSVPQVRELVSEAGLESPPACRVAVLPCTRLNPTGRQTDEGFHIRTLWGEMAYRLHPDAFKLLAEADAQRVSPGEETLEAVLKLAGPSVILLDETLHYVDKVSTIEGPEGDLAKQAVAFLRELTAVVDSLPRNMLVVSLTASRMDQLSSRAQDWLERMEHHINRLAHPCTPIEGTEIHEVVRRRLFETVDENVAVQVTNHYHQLYSGLGNLPAQYVSPAYRDMMRRSYPFHPELITVLYERWGAKPGFQLTRGTLRFLALVLQDLWHHRTDVTTDLIQMGHVSAVDSSIRAMIKDIAGDAQWESVIGSDVAAPASSEQQQPAKAEIIDTERPDGQRLARALATTILLYSVGGGENPEATRHEIRLACARHQIEDATWDDLLDKFTRRLFYFYFDEAKYKFRKEPNVTSLHHTYRVNLDDSGEVDAYINKIILEKALGSNSVLHSFNQVYFLPNRAVDRDDEALKLVVLGFEHTISKGELTDVARQTAMDILEKHGQVLRQRRNTLVFCAPETGKVAEARAMATDFLGWRKIQTNAADWDRIGGAQQEVVKVQMDDTGSGTLRAVSEAYSWALIPAEDKVTARLTLKPVPLGLYGPGKQVAPMVWDSLTSRSGATQSVLTKLTPETFLQRYGAKAWPGVEKWVTTRQLWDRFVSQVSLPILSKEQVFLEMLRDGQYEGLFALALLTDAQSPREQRDSYLHLHFKETLPPNIPVTGERWLVMRPEVYRDIAEQPAHISHTDILTAIADLGGGEHPVTVKTIRKVVETSHSNNIDEVSFVESVKEVLKSHDFAYKQDGQTVDQLPEDQIQFQSGALVKEMKIEKQVKTGRVIVIKGTLGSANDMGPFFKKILQPLATQKPDELTIKIEVRAQFKEDPGSGLDATLDDGFDNNAFPDLIRENRTPY
jgi:hypothetical protein